MLENFNQKKSIVIVYTGEGKGKTTAAIGLTARALGNNFRVAFIQFIKCWPVSEHAFFNQISTVYKNQLLVYEGGRGFYNAGDLSPKNISKQEHQKAAAETLKMAISYSTSGNFDLIVCDEINNAVHDKLLKVSDLKQLIESKHPKTNLCLTGRDFPQKLIPKVDIVTNMIKIKHHFDDKYSANRGIDF